MATTYDWITFSTTTTSSTVPNWYSLDWTPIIKQKIPEYNTDSFYCSILEKYIEKKFITIPAEEKPCFKQMIACLENTNKVLAQELFGSIDSAATALRKLSSNSTLEKQILTILVKEIYKEE